MRTFLVLSLMAIGVAAVGQESTAEYRSRIAKLRQENEAGLKSDNGWLAVAGLFWLQDGDSVSFGLDAKRHLVLPAASDIAGTFKRVGNKVTADFPASSPALFDGTKVDTAEVRFDADKITLGSVTVVLIRRGNRVGFRVYDLNSAARREFKGERWFPIDPAYRVQAKFVAYDSPRTMPITNVLGDTAPVPNPGYVEFTFRGKKCRLEAEDQGANLFFNFQDLTSGKSTYPAGRFLDAAKPVNGIVTLDFNLAINPPCAFTSFATCPLPPAGNKLPVEIKAGELSHHPIEH